VTTPVRQDATLGVPLATITELVRQAKRLGLTWDLRPATVISVTMSADGAYEPRIVMDGDIAVAAITVPSLIGPVAVGTRVMVVAVPPAGNYIIGILSIEAFSRREIGAHTSHSTAITTVETIFTTFTNFTVQAGAAYRWEVSGGIVAVAGTFTQFKLRKTNAAGQILDTSAWINGQGIVPASMQHMGYFRNTGAAAVTSTVVLTAITLSSTATWYADAGLARYVAIQYAGPAVEYPSAVNII
jgi:hypothetical protein